jgi:putative tricarboxylic transport membrane protein
LDFGFIYLWNGVDFLPVAVGLLGLSEIYMSINEYIEIKKGDPSLKFKVKDVFPSLKEYISCLPTQIRCMVLGFFVGVLPGAGATIASMLSYKMEEQIASDRENFGKGSLQGVAAPEAANNACAGGAMVPMLSLGIPGSGTTAILLGALVMVGIQPGPGLFTKHADLVWGLISSMYIGNVMLVIMCIFLIPVFLWLLRISQKTLPVIVAVLCIVGTYSSQNSLFDVGVMFFFSVIGVCFKLLNIPVAPMLVAIILGKDIELRFMQSIVTFKGDLGLFFTRPISLVLFVMCLALFAFPVTRLINERKKRKEIPFG